jgi:hypothetical protein
MVSEIEGLSGWTRHREDLIDEQARAVDWLRPAFSWKTVTLEIQVPVVLT